MDAAYFFPLTSTIVTCNSRSSVDKGNSRVAILADSPLNTSLVLPYYFAWPENQKKKKPSPQEEAGDFSVGFLSWRRRFPQNFLPPTACFEALMQCASLPLLPFVESPSIKSSSRHVLCFSSKVVFENLKFVVAAKEHVVGRYNTGLKLGGNDLDVHGLFNENVQICWAFSIYLEAVAILPQLVLLQRRGNVDNLTGQYVFFQSENEIFEEVLRDPKRRITTHGVLSTTQIESALECSRELAPENCQRLVNINHQEIPAATAPPPPAAAATPPPVTTTPPPPAVTVNNENDGFDFFDPRGVVPAPALAFALQGSGGGEMEDLFGSLSESFSSSNALAVVTSTSSITTEVHPPANTNPYLTFDTSSTSRAFDDPFGDGPFKAVPSTDGFSA
ncbi:unnamed protein product [Lactuca saligna]|uniref:ER lumen protein-retaining receptor n=1 Tax=Lactuca saligna TaxID=75948 RepID=A0AA35Y6P4_LACSI|nr:unnamed protein product [Lactuca saligna]